MEQGAVRHGLRQVDRPAAIGVEMHPRGQQPAFGVEAHLEPREERMPMPGQHHVLVAIPAHAHGLAGVVRRQRGERGRRGRLRFLAAEPAAHAQALHDDLVGRETSTGGRRRLAPRRDAEWRRKRTWPRPRRAWPTPPAFPGRNAPALAARTLPSASWANRPAPRRLCRGGCSWGRCGSCAPPAPVPASGSAAAVRIRPPPSPPPLGRPPAIGQPPAPRFGRGTRPPCRPAGSRRA